MMQFAKERTMLLGELEYSPWIVVNEVIDWILFKLGSRCYSGKFFVPLVDDLLADVLSSFIPASPLPDNPDSNDAVTLLRSRLWLTQVKYGSLMNGPLRDTEDEEHNKLSLLG